VALRMHSAFQATAKTLFISVGMMP